MYAVGIDTSQNFLLLALMKDDELIDSVQEECLKQQSERLLPELDSLLKKHGLKSLDIDSWVITKGPGSYTGVRIAMTLAKVIGSISSKNVYTLSTLQLYAGLRDCYVVLDARAKRVYAGRYRDGRPLMEDCIYSNEQVRAIIDSQQQEVIGDLHLFGLKDSYDHLAENFVSLRPCWEKVENIDILTPTYLKSNAEYLK